MTPNQSIEPGEMRERIAGALFEHDTPGCPWIEWVAYCAAHKSFTGLMENYRSRADAILAILRPEPIEVGGLEVRDPVEPAEADVEALAALYQTPPSVEGGAAPYTQPAETDVEQVARALYEEDDPWHKAWPWPNLNPEAQGGQGAADAYRRLARAAISAMPVSAREAALDSSVYRQSFYGILNKDGDFWTPLVFDSEAKARRHLDDFWKAKSWREADFTIAPVRVRLDRLAADDGEEGR